MKYALLFYVLDVWKGLLLILLKNFQGNSPVKPSSPKASLLEVFWLLTQSFYLLQIYASFLFLSESVLVIVCFRNISISPHYLLRWHIISLVFPYNPFRFCKVSSNVLSFISEFSNLSLLFSWSLEFCQFCCFFFKEPTFSYIDFLYWISITYLINSCSNLQYFLPFAWFWFSFLFLDS